jgi:hypothetical protein
MSAIPEEIQNPPTPEVEAMGGSLKERLARKRRELEENTTFEIPVPGYEKEGLWARYRALGFEDVRNIGIRIEGETSDQVTGERLTAAETLTEACIELLEFQGYGPDGQPKFDELGYRWTAAAGRDLFGIDIPDGVTARDAIMMVFPYPRDLLMTNHFQGYLEASMGYLPQMEEIMRGESAAP